MSVMKTGLVLLCLSSTVWAQSVSPTQDAAANQRPPVDKTILGTYSGSFVGLGIKGNRFSVTLKLASTDPEGNLKGTILVYVKACGGENPLSGKIKDELITIAEEKVKIQGCLPRELKLSREGDSLTGTISTSDGEAPLTLRKQ